MRQQLRLRVLLPLAVLGLLGAGLGAWAFGRAPEPGSPSGGTPPTTTHATAPTSNGKPAETDPGPVSRDVWAQGANALCAKLGSDANALELQRSFTPGELAEYLRKNVRMLETAESDFAELGWPRGEKATVLAMRTDLQRLTRFLRRALAAVEGRELDRIIGIVRRTGGLEPTPDRAFTRLGADQCVEAPDGKEQRFTFTPADTLEWVLLARRAVVVAFYTPDSGLDGAAVWEARAAAASVHAAFIPVNVETEGAVSEIAERYEVTDAPTVLVIVRGSKVAARFGRFADRETVAQAVENALQ
jgi:hypothetical protein